MVFVYPIICHHLIFSKKSLFIHNNSVIQYLVILLFNNETNHSKVELDWGSKCGLPVTTTAPFLVLVSVIYSLIFSCNKQLNKWVFPSVLPSVQASMRNALLKYALQVKGQSGGVKGTKWGQVGSGRVK